MNFGVTILEIVMLSLYSVYIKKKNIKLILGSCLIFGITDLSILTLEAFFKILYSYREKQYQKYNIKIKNRLLDKNSSILVGVLVYIYHRIRGKLFSFF